MTRRAGSSKNCVISRVQKEIKDSKYGPIEWPGVGRTLLGTTDEYLSGPGTNYYSLGRFAEVSYSQRVGTTKIIVQIFSGKKFAIAGGGP